MVLLLPEGDEELTNIEQCCTVVTRVFSQVSDARAARRRLAVGCSCMVTRSPGTTSSGIRRSVSALPAESDNAGIVELAAAFVGQTAPCDGFYLVRVHPRRLACHPWTHLLTSQRPAG
jgi:hypothetical protein